MAQRLNSSLSRRLSTTRIGPSGAVPQAGGGAVVSCVSAVEAVAVRAAIVSGRRARARPQRRPAPGRTPASAATPLTSALTCAAAATATASASGRHARTCALRLADLPRRHAELPGQPVRVPAARRADLGQRAHRVRQRVGDQHVRGARARAPSAAPRAPSPGRRRSSRRPPRSPSTRPGRGGSGAPPARRPCRRCRPPAGSAAAASSRRSDPTASISTADRGGRDPAAVRGAPRRARSRPAPPRRVILLQVVTSAPRLAQRVDHGLVPGAAGVQRRPARCPRPGRRRSSSDRRGQVLARLVGGRAARSPGPRRTARGSAPRPARPGATLGRRGAGAARPSGSSARASPDDLLDGALDQQLLLAERRAGAARRAAVMGRGTHPAMVAHRPPER